MAGPRRPGASPLSDALIIGRDREPSHGCNIIKGLASARSLLQTIYLGIASIDLGVGDQI